MEFVDKRIEHKIFPFSWEGWDIQDTAVFTHYKVIWSEDFGAFKAKVEYNHVNVNYEKGILEYWGDSGEEQEPIIVEYFKAKEKEKLKYTLAYTESFMSGSHMQTVPAFVQVEVFSNEELKEVIKCDYPSTHNVFIGHVDLETNW
jgi:hypothetical protein